MASTSLICVAPISPTYSPTHRYLFYISILVSILYPTPPPLVKGAFAFSLTYSATAALYAVLLLSNSANPPSNYTTVNLDIPAITAILSASAISVLPLQIWTKSLSRSAWNIIRVWGIVITVGLCAVFKLLVHAKPFALSTISSNTISTLESCKVSSGKLKLRNPDVVELVEFDRVFGKWYNTVVKHTSVLVFLPLLFGFLACLVTVRQPNTLGLDGEQGQNNDTDSGLGATASSTTTTFSIRRIFLGIRKVVLDISPAFWITVVVVNELYLLSDGGLPEVESMGEVGQWGVLAGLGFVALAASWNDILAKEQVKKIEEGDAIV